MKAVSQFLLFVVASMLLLIVVNRIAGRRDADRPAEMPPDAQFTQTGYDLAHNEQEGDWIACRLDRAQAADLCRVTNQTGTVFDQGDLLPLSRAAPLAGNDLTIGRTVPDSMWVRGPAEQQPVRVNALRNGEHLVRTADRDALVPRWLQQPEEKTRVLTTQQ